MENYTYIIDDGLTQKTVNITAPSDLLKLYKVTCEGKTLGALMREEYHDGETIWRCTTKALIPLKDELGDFILKTDAGATAN